MRRAERGPCSGREELAIITSRPNPHCPFWDDARGPLDGEKKQRFRFFSAMSLFNRVPVLVDFRVQVRITYDVGIGYQTATPGCDGSTGMSSEGLFLAPQILPLSVVKLLSPFGCEAHRRQAPKGLVQEGG